MVLDLLHTEPETHKLLINRLQPVEDGGSDDGSKKRAAVSYPRMGKYFGNVLPIN